MITRYPCQKGNAIKFAIAFLLIIALCAQHSPVPAAPGGAITDELAYFPSDYDQSRALFQALCEQKLTELGTPQSYCRSEPVDSSTDRDLTIDYAFFGGSGDKLIVIQSGIHGWEAPTGAAVQELVFRKYLKDILARRIDVFFIHALNPYGFKNIRRTDEANVNLNRNFLLDWNDPRKKNDNYERLRSMFEPQGPVQNVQLASLRNDARFVGTYIGGGFDKAPLRDGLDAGQYRFEKGINFGGSGPAQQVRFLERTLGPLFSDRYRKVLFLDYHTGLGNNGQLAIIKPIHPEPVLMGQLETLFRGNEKQGIVFQNADEFPTIGDVIDFVPVMPGRAAAGTPPILAVTMEYGTMGTDILSQVRSASRIILENQSHFFGCISTSVCDQIRDNFKELFNPSDADWRNAVMREANITFELLANGF